MEQNNSTFHSIIRMINALDLYLNIDIDKSNEFWKVIYKISNQLEIASNSEWTKSDLNNYIFDNDVIDYLDANDVVYSDSLKADIRDIQNAIINFFGE